MRQYEGRDSQGAAGRRRTPGGTPSAGRHPFARVRTGTAWGCLVSAGVLVGIASAGSAAEHHPATPLLSEQTPELRAAIEKGLQWLADNQAPDGAYGHLSHYGPHVGITALAGLAFMSDGNMPGRGRHGEPVARSLSFILAHSSESGLLTAETSHGPMYGHGFATLFLAEIYGMDPRPEIRETLRKAVRLIVSTQNDEGGWRYQPVRNDADISVTICQVMALRAARNAGIYVDKGVIDKAITYVKQSQNPDGGFRYMLSSGGSAFARSAAGVAALQYAGIYSGEEIERGLEYLSRYTPPKERTVGHYFYGHYYAAQAMFLAGDAYWPKWFPAIRAELLEKQEPEGFWRGQAGHEYGTAMALIILQMPNRLLPIFQK
ncbi:MAG: terpene cyclase/mutase family protein [Planctomycetes bacterium]|nr:terpene cyclase/mutase family protein [Planctomycetota bacterium]